MELTFVCMGNKSISTESAENFHNMEYVFRNVVGIHEDVVQIYDDYDLNHICENIIHKSLKSGRCISKPFRHYQPLEGTIKGSECRLPFVSSVRNGNLEKGEFTRGKLDSTGGLGEHSKGPRW